MMPKKDYTGVLLEDIDSKMSAILEAVGAMNDSVKKIPKMAERIEKLESDMSTVRLATMGSSHDLKMIKIRTEKLEDILDDVTDLQKRVKAIEQTA